MGTHPSKRFEDDVLVERAISTNEPGDPNEAEAKAAKPYKAPEPVVSRLGAKRVAASDDVENKAVKKATKKAAKK